jgi:hypothetical protein
MFKIKPAGTLFHYKNEGLYEVRIEQKCLRSRSLLALGLLSFPRAG